MEWSRSKLAATSPDLFFYLSYHLLVLSSPSAKRHLVRFPTAGFIFVRSSRDDDDASAIYERPVDRRRTSHPQRHAGIASSGEHARPRTNGLESLDTAAAPLHPGFLRVRDARLFLGA